MRHKGLPKRVSEERELHVPLEDPICKQTQSPAKWPLVSHIECAKCGDPIDKNLLAQGGEKKRNAAFCHRCVCPDRGCINRAVVAPGYCAECIQRLESAKKSAESQLMQDAIDKLSELGQEVITAVEEFKQLLQRN